MYAKAQTSSVRIQKRGVEGAGVRKSERLEALKVWELNRFKAVAKSDAMGLQRAPAARSLAPGQQLQPPMNRL